MMREQEHLPPGVSALAWALGCVVVSYKGKLRAMMRLPALLRRVALLVILVLCLTPPSWNFFYIALSAAQGYPLSPVARLMFGSATLIGPIGIAAVLWTLSSPAHRPGTRSMLVLWALTAWGVAMVRLPAQYPLLTHTAHATPETQVFTILLNFVILPVLAVTRCNGWTCADAGRQIERMAVANVPFGENCASLGDHRTGVARDDQPYLPRECPLGTVDHSGECAVSPILETTLSRDAMGGNSLHTALPSLTLQPALSTL